MLKIQNQPSRQLRASFAAIGDASALADETELHALLASLI